MIQEERDDFVLIEEMLPQAVDDMYEENIKMKKEIAELSQQINTLKYTITQKKNENQLLQEEKQLIVRDKQFLQTQLNWAMNFIAKKHKKKDAYPVSDS